MTDDYYEEQGGIEQWRDDAETQRLLDKVCEGVKVPDEEEQPEGKRPMGLARGMFTVPKDFNDPDPEIEADAPCCGGDSMDDGYGTWADEAWHDAQEYPDW